MTSGNDSALQRLCKGYGVDIVKTKNLSGRYSCIVFTQAYNEQHHAREFIENINLFSDGVVVLDDGSTDGTGDAFMGDQVVIHLRRSVNSRFNDYSNRSLLMELGMLLDTRWMLFLDLDERIVPAYTKAFKWLLGLKGAEHIRFRYVHLWDKETHYRTDYPHSEEGVQYRLKMVRRKNQMGIPEKKRLHFELKPYHSVMEMRSQILILHLGSLSSENRHRRYEIYNALDPDNQCQSSYEHLISPDARTRNVDALHKPSQYVILNDLIAYLSMIWNAITGAAMFKKRPAKK